MRKANHFILAICLILLSRGLAEADNTPEQEVYQLEAISVMPGKFSISEGAPSPYIIPKTEMEKLPLIDNDIYRSAHNLPGVAADDFSARFSVRGGDRDEVVVRLDGMELYDPYHLQDFGGAISAIDMGIVRDADLLTGGFPAEYGDAMSGVFDITSAQLGRGRVSGNAGIDLLNTHVILGGFPWLLSARRGYIDLLMELIDSEETFKPRYYDLYGKVSYDLGSSDKIYAHILYAGDSDEIDRTGIENDLASRYWNGMLWAKWRHIADEKTLWDFYIFSGRAGREKNEGVDGEDNRNTSYAGMKGEVIYSPTPAHKLKAGWRWQVAEADYHFFLREDQAITSVDASPTGWDLSGYIQDEWQISDRLAGNAGLRGLYQSYGGHFAIMPRLALAARLRRDLTLRGAWGIYKQPVQVANLPVEQGIDESKPPEEAIHYILASEYSPTASLLLRIETYYKTFHNLVGRMRDSGRKEQFFISPESGSAGGIEIFAKHALTPRFTWGLAYALSRSEVEEKIPRDFDRRHSLSVNSDYALWNDMWINVVWRYHSGDPYTDTWYEQILSEKSYVWEKRYGPANGERLPPYHSLDVRLTKNFRFKHWEMILYLQILNLYNRANVHEYAFEAVKDDEGNVLSYERIEEHFLPVLPAVGIVAQF